MIKINKRKILLQLFIIIVLLTSGSGIQVLYPLFVSQIAIITAAVCTAAVILYKKYNRLLYLVALYVLVYFASMFMNFDLSRFSTYLILASLIVISYYISTIYDLDDFVGTYINTIFAFTVVSLVFYFIVNSNPSLVHALRKTSVNSYFRYNTIFIFNWIEGLDQRNCGPFWEPGIFASHLILAMNFELLFGRKSKIKLFIFALALLTCNSSAGFFLSAIVIAELFLQTSSFNDSISKRIWRLLIIVILMLVIINLDFILETTGLINNEYMTKLTTERINENTRVLSIGFNISRFVQSPLLGNGLTASVANSQVMTPDTTTTFYLLNLLGISGIFYTIFLGRGILKTKNISLSHRLCLLVTLLIIINKEPHYEFSIVWCLILILNKYSVDSVGNNTGRTTGYLQ